jgi:cobaltochelatase CobN
VILFLTNADTEILALRSLIEGLPAGFPRVRAENPARMGDAPRLGGAQAVLVRLLGGRRAWEGPFAALRASCVQAGVPLLAFGGEASPDPELAAASTVPRRVLERAFDYLAQGGMQNLENLLRFVADEVLSLGFGFGPPVEVPGCGILEERERVAGRPSVGVVFYRAHMLSGNTQFVTDLCDALERHGANPVPLYCYSLRSPAGEGGDTGAQAQPPALSLLAERGVDALVTTVLASGSIGEEGWDASALASLGVPVVQAVASTSESSEWRRSPAGLQPLDVAMSVAIPELDGRIVSVPFSFKERVDDGDELGSPVSAYRTVADRVERVAGLAARLASLRRKPVGERRIALVLSAYPTRRSRIGNAVALDTPASVLALLSRMAEAGYAVEGVPRDGDELMARLADGLTYDGSPPGRTAGSGGSMSAASYCGWFRGLPEDLRGAVEEAWGPAPGTVQRRGGPGSEELAFAGVELGSVFIGVQPPRGFGENPVAVYHSPDLPPTHHYLAFYRWLDAVWGADAIVHMGKHGTLEWLPGKGVGLSSSCAPDAALGDVPMVYPFVVNDPGEGAQAKRRAHSVIVDHMVAPMTRAETYDDLARLEGLLDAHAQVASLDPSKLPAIRRQVWDLVVGAEIHRDIGLAAGDGHAPPSFDDPSFDDLLLEVDGYLCELKDAQVRGGLHVLGSPPSGTAELDMVLAITRLPQGRVPSLRRTVADAIGADLSSRKGVETAEAECRRRLEQLQRAGWAYGGDDPTLAWVCERLVPALRATRNELDGVMDALDGRFVPPGPAGAPTRGMAHVLPTGRNFYSLDPRAVPSPLAWEVGRELAGRLLERHLSEEGRYPASVGLVVWGTAAMRTGGDDVAEALALMGVKPVWAAESGRVEGVELVPANELGRPRVDVTLRISGFFRDAFPHVLELLEEAVELAAGADEPPELNPIAAHGASEPRVFGPRPGAYGAGILPLLESGDWRGDDDLAAVYLAWGGYSYGRSGMGVPAEDAMRRRLELVEVAVKNQDNREHDIFDSDDYLQDHGGMVAAVRFLTGRQPKAWFGDSSDPGRLRVRPLSEEAARVVRTRAVNPRWIEAMRRHGYKGAFEMAATVDYLFGYDATARVVEDWMYEAVTERYVADASVRKFFEESNPWALRSIAERLLEASERGLWDASGRALAVLRAALLEAEGWEEGR